MSTIRELLVRVGLGVDRKSFTAGERGVGRMRGLMAGAAQNASNLKQSIIGAATAYLGLNTAVTAGRSLFAANVSAESLKAGLVGVTGSAEGAKKAWADMLTLTAETPFLVEQVTGAFIRLGNIGMDNSNRALIAYGDIASSIPGKEIVDFAEAVADAATGEFERLKEFGIKASKDGDTVKMTFKGVTKEITNDAVSIEKALIELAEQNFGGSMARQMNTLGGVVSNLKGQFFLLMLRIGEGGLNDVLRDLLLGITGNIEGITTLATGIGGALAAAITGIITIFKFWVEHALEAKLALGGLTIMLGRMGTAALIAQAKLLIIPAILILLALLIGDFIGFTQGKDSIFGRLFGDLDGVPEMAAGVFGQLKGILQQGVQVAIGVLEQIWTAILGVWPVIQGVLKRIGSLYLSWIMFQVGIIRRYVIPMVSKVVAHVISVVQRVVPMYVRVFRKIAATLFGLIEELSPVVQSIIKEVWSFLGPIVDTILAGASALIDTIIEAVERLLPRAVEIIASIIRIAMPLIKTAVGIFMRILKVTIDYVVPVGVKLLGWLIGFAVTAIEVVFSIVEWLIGAITKYVLPVVEAIGGAFTSVMDTVIGVVGFIVGLWTAVSDWLASIFDDPIDAIEAVFEGLKFSLTEIFNAIKETFGEIADLADDAMDLVGLGDDDEGSTWTPETSRALGFREDGAGEAGAGSSATIDTINVQVAGSTDMSPQELENATRAGVMKAAEGFAATY